MTDYIKREDAMEAIGNFLSKEDDYFVDMAKGTIKLLKSADVAPVRHGRWIKDKMPMYSWGGEKIGEKSTWECSECHDVGFWGYNYCPNCGARMDGESDE